MKDISFQHRLSIGGGAGICRSIAGHLFTLSYLSPMDRACISCQDERDVLKVLAAVDCLVACLESKSQGTMFQLPSKVTS